MHRFTVSLLAFLGAVAFPPRDGRADPRAANPPARAEVVPAKDESEAPAKRDSAGAPKTEGDPAPKKASDPGHNGKPEGKEKTTELAVEGKKSAAPEPNPKKPEAGAAGSKSSGGDVASMKMPASSATGKGPAPSKGVPAWTRRKPGVVKLVRGSETLEVRVFDQKQRLVPATLPQFARFLRSKSGADHPIDGRLVTVVATVSDHFGGREVNVVSGYRPYTRGQYSRHSNHNEGRAIDFSIKGIANETVRDFCRTLRNVGVGYYPNSLFVHLDVRDGNAYWVDYAAPGQAPRYRAVDGKDDPDEDAIASVDADITSVPSHPTTREDVMRGKNNARSADGDMSSEHRVFVNR